MEVNDNNIEEQILLLADGELDPAAAEAVMDYIGQHPACQEMLDMYLSVKLLPEAEVAFPDKEILLRKEPAAIPVKARAGTSAWRWAVAATLLLTVSITATVLFRQPEYKGAPLVAKQYSGPKRVSVSAAKDSFIAAANTRQAVRSEEHHPVAKRRPVKLKHQSQAIAVVRKERRMELLTPIETVRGQSIPVTERPVAVWDRKETIATATSESPSSWSPLKEETVEGINELVAQVRTLKEDVREKTQLLKKATIVLRLGNKEIALNK